MFSLQLRPRTRGIRDVGVAKWLWSYAGAILVFIVIMAVSHDAVGTLTASASSASFFMLVGIGQMLVITLGPGNIDLSIPYTIGLAGFVAMKLMNAANNKIAFGLVAGLVVGAAVGAFNFALIRLIRVPPMIATLASGFIVQTVSIVLFRGLQIKPPTSLSTFVARKFGIIPLLFLLVLAIGQNAKAASLAAINVNANRLFT